MDAHRRWAHTEHNKFATDDTQRSRVNDWKYKLNKREQWRIRCTCSDDTIRVKYRSYDV